jgi:hypothetical protein
VRVRELAHATDVVDVEMREDEPADVATVRPAGPECGGDGVPFGTLESSESQPRMPGRPSRTRDARSEARVEQAEAERMVDEHDVDRQRGVAPTAGKVAKGTRAALAAHVTREQHLGRHLGRVLLNL